MASLKNRTSLRAILMGSALLILIAILIAFILYNKPQRSVENESAIAITATQLFKEFEQNEEKANEMYLNKAVLVTGTVSEISLNQDGKTVLILETENPMFGVSCTMEGTLEGSASGSTIKVKGICTGYLSDVVLTRAIISK